MKKLVCIIISMSLLLFPATINAAEEFEIGWQADMSQLDLWETENYPDITPLVRMDAPEEMRFVHVEHTQGSGFKMWLDEKNAESVPWKAVVTRVTVDLDETPYFHIRHSSANVNYMIKASDQPDDPTLGQDVEFVPQSMLAGEPLMIDIKTNTGWSGEKTFWIKYFMIDSSYSSEVNEVQYMMITSSMMPPAVETSTETNDPVETSTDTSNPVDSSDETPSDSTPQEEPIPTDDDQENEESGVSPIAIAVVIIAVLAVTGAAIYFLKMKKK